MTSLPELRTTYGILVGMQELHAKFPPLLPYMGLIQLIFDTNEVPAEPSQGFYTWMTSFRIEDCMTIPYGRQTAEDLRPVRQLQQATLVCVHLQVSKPIQADNLMYSMETHSILLILARRHVAEAWTMTVVDANQPTLANARQPQMLWNLPNAQLKQQVLTLLQRSGLSNARLEFVQRYPGLNANVALQPGEFGLCNLATVVSFLMIVACGREATTQNGTEAVQLWQQRTQAILLSGPDSVRDWIVRTLQRGDAACPSPAPCHLELSIKPPRRPLPVPLQRDTQSTAPCTAFMRTRITKGPAELGRLLYNAVSQFAQSAPFREALAAVPASSQRPFLRLVGRDALPGGSPLSRSSVFALRLDAMPKDGPRWSLEFEPLMHSMRIRIDDENSLMFHTDQGHLTLEPTTIDDTAWMHVCTQERLEVHVSVRRSSTDAWQSLQVPVILHWRERIIKHAFHDLAAAPPAA
jgi:hypothetical protein